MSEDVKPRLKTTDETFGLMARTEIVNWIELEPTMRLIDELADILETSAKRNISPRFYAREVLEKYRKFKEALK